MVRSARKVPYQWNTITMKYLCLAALVLVATMVSTVTAQGKSTTVSVQLYFHFIISDFAVMTFCFLCV